MVNVCTDSTDGLVHESPNDSEIIAENAKINSDFDMVLIYKVHLNEVDNFDIYFSLLFVIFFIKYQCFKLIRIVDRFDRR